MRRTDLPEELADAIAEAHDWRRKSELSLYIALTVGLLTGLAPLWPYFLLALPLAFVPFAYYAHSNVKEAYARNEAHDLALKLGKYGLVGFIFNGEFEQ